MNPGRKVSLRELDFNNTGSWPREVRIGACVIVGLLVFGLLSWLLIRDKHAQLKNLEAQEATKRSEFELKQGRAANLEPLKQQLVLMEQQLQQMLRQLPSRTEMPDLITDISQTALATGIQNNLFRPGPETVREFYAEQPIDLRMQGGYHQFGAFVSGVASLPRVVIMTMHDISLSSRNPRAPRPGMDLELAGTIKTYRYLDDDEIAVQQGDSRQGGR